jgi:hypothetical protein
VTNEDQTRVLRMVAEGKITAEEGGKLLEALTPLAPQSSAMSNIGEGELVEHDAVSRKFLMIQIRDNDESKVHLRIPLGLARTASKFMPRAAVRRLEQYDIKLQDLIDSLGATLAEGPIIDVKDGDSRVTIAVVG